MTQETIGHGKHTPRRLHIFGAVDLRTDGQEYCGSSRLMQTDTALVEPVEPSDGIEATARRGWDCKDFVRGRLNVSI